MTVLAGKRAIVTGAASGIGRATAARFAEQGASVVLADVAETALKQTVDVLGTTGAAVHAVPTDVSDESAVRDLAAAAARLMGGIDVVVNVAGMQRSASVTETGVESWDKHAAVNARSCFLTAKHTVPHLKRGNASSFITVASIAALKGIPGLTAYAASKGAVVAFTRALAIELASDQIRANCLCPGWVDTPFNDPVVSYMGGRAAHEQMVATTVPLGRQGQPPDMADTIVFLASDASRYLTGQAIVVDGGITS
ncbi:MAG: SDR family NAD(P)-dependent oxidoreductase [Pseudonocardia sp.]